MLIVWGERDPIIPVRHGRDAHEAIPGSRLEVFEDVGHMPQLETPARFVHVLEAFLEETEPARFDPDEWGARLHGADGPGAGDAGRPGAAPGTGASDGPRDTAEDDGARDTAESDGARAA